MKQKPITPLMHGIIDYAFALALLSVPSLIKLDKKARKLYAVNALRVISYSAFTKYPPAIKQIIPLQLHKQFDCAILSLLLLKTFNKNIRRSNRAKAFHISVVAAGVITVLLTDWNKSNKKF